MNTVQDLVKIDTQKKMEEQLEDDREVVAENHKRAVQSSDKLTDKISNKENLIRKMRAMSSKQASEHIFSKNSIHSMKSIMNEHQIKFALE